MNAFDAVAPLSDPMRYIVVVPHNAQTHDAIERVRAATHFDPALLQALADTGQSLFPLHQEEALRYQRGDELQATYQWIDPNNPQPEGMLQITGAIESGTIDKDSVIMMHGADFKGVLIYKMSCCADPSAVLIGFDDEPLIRDNIGGTQGHAQKFWDDRVFVAEESEDLGNMMHALQDVTGSCQVHASNKRKFVALAAS